MRDNYIFLIVGPSGSGKTTLAKRLSLIGLHELQSYTTRPPRFPGETGHIFVSEFKAEHPVAYTNFNGYDYWATAEQVDASDVYVIDPAGIEWFLSQYHGKRVPIIVYLDVPEDVCRARMKERGDSDEAVEGRIEHDRKAFEGVRTKVIARLYGADGHAFENKNDDDMDRIIKTIQIYLETRR